MSLIKHLQTKEYPKAWGKCGTVWDSEKEVLFANIISKKDKNEIYEIGFNIDFITDKTNETIEWLSSVLMDTLYHELDKKELHVKEEIRESYNDFISSMSYRRK